MPVGAGLRSKARRPRPSVTAMDLAESVAYVGPSLLHSLAVLAFMLAGMALMIGFRRWAGRLLLLGLFLALMVGFV